MNNFYHESNMILRKFWNLLVLIYIRILCAYILFISLGKMEGKVQLGYWEIRGLSERIRMIMEYLSIPYEMVNYNQGNREQWFN